MKVLKNFIISFILFAVAVLAAVMIHSADRPQELKALYAEPEVLRSGATMVFKFVFNTPMDVSRNPVIHLNMEGRPNVSFAAIWYDENTCGYSFIIPPITESGTAEITLTGATTREGKEVGEIQATMKTMPGPNRVP